MCEPVSMGILAGVGALTSAYGQYRSGRAQARQAEYQAELAARNAQQARYQADYEREAAKEEAARHRRNVGSTLGAQRSLLAASGADLSDPDSSALNILGDTAQWGEYDAQKILHQGEVKTWTYENQAAGARAESLMYGRGVGQSKLAGAVGAGASLLSDAGQVARTWYRH